MELTHTMTWKQRLLTPPDFGAGARVQTNLDTNFLKLIAMLAMLIDHIGGAFFPGQVSFRLIGRLAFPLYCYCMTVGLLYTRDIKRYLARLGVFALLSQPFYILAFHPEAFTENVLSFNIFFTLLLSLAAMWGVRSREWWLFVLAFFALCWWNFDYSGGGVQLMLIFYLCRSHPRLGAALFALSYLPALWSGVPGDPMSFQLFGHWVGFELTALLALPLIFLHTHVQPKIPKWVFYAFYPAHLAAIFLVRCALGV